MSLLRSRSVCTTPGTCAECHLVTSALTLFPMASVLPTARNCQSEFKAREEGSAASSGNAASRERWACEFKAREEGSAASSGNAASRENKSKENTAVPRLRKNRGRCSFITALLFELSK